jgi:hypothetical protein
MPKCTQPKKSNPYEKMEKMEPKREQRNTAPEKKEYKQLLSVLPKKK